ncbi:MAG TPA: 5-amino-6-(D-ribitylamino)uracil--L-tyrosine 4-hydroxyphenyl transferase CofH [Micropepsaceae bacterium]|nr:5-amino-6-(D-ribitylamino)uracil--L-tyrosine 4-hydroxyphenyl transferase CofH [Micropepsaceae bacterium]
MIKALDSSWNEVDCETALARARPAFAAILERALDGSELGFADGLALAQASGDDLLALVKSADHLRRRTVGDVLTYVVNRNLNFTNICIVGCSFCGFSRGPRAKDAYFHSTDALLTKTRNAVAAGATEVCIQGGLPKNLDGGYYAGLLRDISAEFPQLHLHAYSPMEISYGVEKTGLSLSEHLISLKEAGIGSIPGTAAEILDDSVRGELSPNKLTAKRWIEVIRAAHGLGIPSTSTMMYGHTETPEHWVRHMLLLREIQRETGGFTEFVPLGFIHSKTRLFRKGHARAGSSFEEDLIVHALARLLLNRDIPNLQVSWVKLGFPGALACLQAGANDFSGTLMEESISRAAGADYGESVTPGELRAMIRSIGRIPAERSTTYNTRRLFDVSDGDERLPLERMPAPATGHVPLAVGY